MAKIYESITELVGGTPLLHLSGIERTEGLFASLYAKLEYFNPAGSAKDRVALEMVLDAERCGRLKPGGVIIEPTSGNTGIGIAMIAAARGYEAIIVMPDTMSVERRKIIGAFGARIVLSDGALGMRGAIDLANEIHRDTPGSIIAGQFENPANPMAHYKTTGQEIYRDTDGEVDIFISAVGTGGTVSGVGKYLKEKKNNVKIIAVEPTGSPVLSKGYSGKHGIQGIGAGFVPKTLDTEIYDEVIAVSENEAYAAARLAGAADGVLVGISSGAALSAALTIAKREENRGKKIVVLLPDTGERYLSCNLFN